MTKTAEEPAEATDLEFEGLSRAQQLEAASVELRDQFERAMGQLDGLEQQAWWNLQRIWEGKPTLEQLAAIEEEAYAEDVERAIDGAPGDELENGQ